MDKPKATAKDFFLWFGAMVALYWSVFALVSLIFDYLNYAMPDALQYFSGDPYSSSISYEMASLIVLSPIFLVLMRIIRRSIGRDASRAEIWVRRWALVLTLFIAGATVAGDLIALVQYFFNGDITLRFLLKVIVLLLVVGGLFLHFLADLKGYWQANPRKSRLIGIATGVLVLVTIVAGFLIVGTPWQARTYRYDDQKVSDMQMIQNQIVSYWQAKQKLPKALADLDDPISGYSAPSDPQTGAAYEYIVTGTHSFKLCTSFNAQTQSYSLSAIARMAPVAPVGYPSKASTPDNWQHGAGRVCFKRTIDPQLYPPLTK